MEENRHMDNAYSVFDMLRVVVGESSFSHHGCIMELRFHARTVIGSACAMINTIT